MIVEALEDRTLLSAPHPVDLGSLDGNNGFRLDGNEAFDFSGNSVDSAGDFNGDGFDDVFVGTPGGDFPGVFGAGEAYVFFGRAGGFDADLDLAALDGTHGFRLDGIDVLDRAGTAVSTAGDVNGDGFDDLLVGAPRADPGGEEDAGEAYVVFGRGGGFAPSMDLAALDGTNGFRLEGIDAGDEAGRSVSEAGDVNGDGLDDILIGAPRAAPNGTSDAGESYLVFGRSDGFAPVLDLSTLGGSNGFRLEGVDADDRSGSSVSDAGDVNGDGFDDLIVGAPRADAGGDSRAGESFVVFGRSNGFAPVVELSTLDGANGFRLDGIGAGDNAGTSVSGAGDVDGDGWDDLIVGANGADPGGKARAGESYLLFGRSSGFAPSIDLSTLDGISGFRLEGIDAGDRSGISVSGAGDVNGDGFGDLMIGARNADPGGVSGAGENYVVFGRAGGFGPVFELSTLDGNNGFRLDGIDQADRSGKSVSGAGDVNGDGFDDVVTSAFAAAADGINRAGETYTVFGGNFTGGAETQVGDGTDNMLTAAQGAGSTDILIGAQGNDVLAGDGGPDILRGGQGDDVLAVAGLGFRRLIGGRGTDTLRLDTSNVAFDLAAIPDNRITGIERIDITGLSRNAMALNRLEVVNLSNESNIVTVFGNADDLVDIGPEWELTGTQTVGGQTVDVFTQGEATLRISQDVGTVVRSVLTVNSLADSVNDGDGELTLREAIRIANDSSGATSFEGVNSIRLADTIVFDDSVFDAATDDTIVMDGTPFDRITEPLTIDGFIDDGTGRVVLDADEGSRIFEIDSGTTAELTGLTITGGRADDGDPGVRTPDDFGGGIVNNGTLTITNTTVSDNAALFGGGVLNRGRVHIAQSTITGNTAGSDAAGLWNFPDAVATVTDSTIVDNSAGFDGGGLENDGKLTVIDTTLSGNSAGDDGAGVMNDGSLEIINSTVADNSARNAGGGIYNNAGSSAEITDSTLSGNTATNESGGGVFNRGNAELTVVDTLVSNNETDGHGGAIANRNSTVTITESTISGNSADNRGGAIWNEVNGTVTVVESTLSQNSAENEGGAVWNEDGGTLTVVESTIADNSSENEGGGIRSGIATTDVHRSLLVGNSSRDGGAVANYRGRTRIFNSTVSGNTGTGNGGGLFNGSDGRIEVFSSTITNNRSGVDNGFTGFDTGGGIANRFRVLVLENSIVAGNFQGTGAATVPDDIAGTVTDGAFNLIGNASTAGGLVDGSDGNQVDVDPRLGPLADNGGPTFTHALLPGSPAVDAGDNALAVDPDGNPFATDQ